MATSTVRKRERENPCGVCGHYHKHEEGEVCGICGHRVVLASSERPAQQGSAFPSEILKDFLYLGSYDNASRSELLKTIGISRIINTVPACQNLYRNSFTYHGLEDANSLQFDDAIQFLEQCEKDKARVLVHCMSGKNKSPAIVMAYLMKSKGWRLAQSFQWVKDRRPQVDLSEGARHQLLEYEQKIFGSNEPVPVQAFPPSDPTPSFGFVPPGMSEAASIPVFRQPATSSIFERMGPNINTSNFVFGAGITGSNSSGVVSSYVSEASMDSS